MPSSTPIDPNEIGNPAGDDIAQYDKPVKTHSTPGQAGKKKKGNRRKKNKRPEEPVR